MAAPPALHPPAAGRDPPPPNSPVHDAWGAFSRPAGRALRPGPDGRPNVNELRAILVSVILGGSRAALRPAGSDRYGAYRSAEITRAARRPPVRAWIPRGDPACAPGLSNGWRGRGRLREIDSSLRSIHPAHPRSAAGIWRHLGRPAPSAAGRTGGPVAASASLRNRRTRAITDGAPAMAQQRWRRWRNARLGTESRHRSWSLALTDAGIRVVPGRAAVSEARGRTSLLSAASSARLNHHQDRDRLPALPASGPQSGRPAFVRVGGLARRRASQPDRSARGYHRRDIAGTSRSGQARDQPFQPSRPRAPPAFAEAGANPVSDVFRYSARDRVYSLLLAAVHGLGEDQRAGSRRG